LITLVVAVRPVSVEEVMGKFLRAVPMEETDTISIA
jgi:hypothetical protein